LVTVSSSLWFASAELSWALLTNNLFEAPIPTVSIFMNSLLILITSPEKNDDIPDKVIKSLTVPASAANVVLTGDWITGLWILLSRVIKALEPWGGEIELKLIREIFDICEIDFWIAGLNILHFKAHQLTDEILLSFIDQIKIYDNFKINYKIISILKRRESEIVCKLLYKYSLNKELEIAKYAIFSLGSIWNDYSFEQLSKLENEIKDPFLLKCIKNQKLISNQFLINK